MQTRSYEKELLDLGPAHYTPAEYEDCLKKLGQVGRWLGGDRISFNALQRFEFTPRSILDVGCGGGDFTAALAARYPDARVRGIDLNPDAIDYAKRHHKAANLTFVAHSLEAESDEWDVSTATLMTHHLTDEELVQLLRQMLDKTRRRVLVNDLHRHWIPYAFYRLVAPPLFRNRLITADGLLSIKRSFRRSDWARYQEELRLDDADYTVRWHPLFRWTVELRCDSNQ